MIDVVGHDVSFLGKGILLCFFWGWPLLDHLLLQLHLWLLGFHVADIRLLDLGLDHACLLLHLIWMGNGLGLFRLRGKGIGERNGNVGAIREIIIVVALRE